jgi:CheY-like chemotaxis protein
MPASSSLTTTVRASSACRRCSRIVGARIVTATSGEEALRCVLDDDFAAILMDVRMPGIDGFTTARMIRERKRSRYTPIIFLTAASEDFSQMFKGYEAGAVDYIAKPVIPEVLRTKLAVFVGLHDMNRMLSAELAERALTEQRLRGSEENLRALAGTPAVGARGGTHPHRARDPRRARPGAHRPQVRHRRASPRAA